MADEVLYLNYINWDEPDKNIWQVTDEFSVERSNGKYARPDIVILINGIPLVVTSVKIKCMRKV